MQPFVGNDRFQVRGILGQGGFGVVYEAHDAEQEIVVALKQVRELGAEAIRRFKSEFRALADFVHPNLVSLYELFQEGEHWFFTMELVRGENFLRFVRPGFYRAASATYNLSLVSDDGDRSGEPMSAAPDCLGVLDEERLRLCLRQLVVGVSALHDAGILHRDLKPNNLMVTPDSRLVLLDFGLAAELAARRHGREALRIGTPVYMAPETASGAGLSEASDWYAVGVLLYEALTGGVPFLGTPNRVLASKRMIDPPSVHDINPDAPEDLAALADALIRRDPSARPPPSEIRRRTGAQRGSRGDHRFVGRGTELAALECARKAAEDGAGGVVVIRGPSGVGKSMLLERFLSHRRDQGDGVFTGRCYERERVPFKALDALVEDVAVYLRSLNWPTRRTLQPLHDAAMVRVFPGFDGLFDQTSPVDLSEGELRRRAGLALRDLLTRMAGWAPVVLCIDDIQWGDVDSASMLVDLFRHPAPPKVLLVVTMRPDAKSTPVHEALVALKEQGVACTDLPVGPLSESEARDLLSGLLPTEEATDALLREAGGLPFLLDVMARHVREHGVADVCVEDIVQRRLATLPPDVLALLQWIAVSGQPLERAVLRHASCRPGDYAGITRLVREQLVRSEGPPGQERVDTYHDKVRTAALATADVSRLHRGLADALEALGVGDAQRWFVHHRGAGHAQRAAALAIEAAGASAEALAFDNAAQLYEAALELQPQPPEVLEDYARALRNAGRPYEAGEAFLNAADALPDGDYAMDLRRIAGQQFLSGGHADRGVEVLEPVLAAQGFSLARSPNRALISLLANRARLWWRSLDFDLRADPDPADLRKTDLLWSVASALSVLDSIRATDFQVRHLMAALRTGESTRICRALALEGVYAVTESAKGLGRSEAVLTTARELYTAAPHAHGRAMLPLALGMREFLLGRWPSACAAFEDAEPKLRLCRDVTWELSQHATWYLDALSQRGFYGRLRTEIPPRLSEARQKGNLQLIYYLAYAQSCFVGVADDDPESGLQRMHATFVDRAQHGFTTPDWWRMTGLSVLHAYAGDSATAWEVWEADWAQLRNALQLRVDVMAVPGSYHRARLALCRARDTGDAGFVRVAKGEARRLSKSTTGWGAALCGLVRALVAQFEGRPFMGLLEAAETDLMALDMRVHALSARIRRGHEVEESLATLRSLGFKEPMRVADLFAPVRP